MTPGLQLVLLVVLSSPAANPLEHAMNCYEELDYACAESRLAEALGTNLTTEERVKAHLYEALVATAWRNPQRARRAVRAIYQLTPDYVPLDPPPTLAQIFRDERPRAAPPPRLLLGIDYRLTNLVDENADASWWMTGDGMLVSLGMARESRYSLSIELAYGQHQPRNTTLGLESLQMWSADILARHWIGLGKLHLKLGVSLGLNYVNTNVISVYNRLLDTRAIDPFTATQLGLNIEVCYPIYGAFGLSLGTSPRVMIRNYKDQPRLSYLLPIQVGLRYGRE
jgi:hypothetical protein